MWRIDDPQGNEAAKIKYEIVRYTRGRGLDLGCGPFKLYPHFIGVDNGHHAQEFGWDMKPDVMVPTCEKLDMFATQSMDFVFSSHLLEHIKDYEKALKEWWRVIKPGGYLVLYIPDEDLYPKVGEPGANPDHKENWNRDRLLGVMSEIGGWDCVVNELRNHDNGPGEYGNEYSFLQVYKKRTDSKHLKSWQNQKPKKTAAVVRYGGYGDMLQASSIFPGLKAQGYHITVYTTPKAMEAVINDPNIDDFFIQDTDQVPNHELHEFWKVQAKKYTKFINLSESVEASLLPMHGQTFYHWPHSVRHKALNVNYMERTHDIAEVPMPPKIQFYPTEDEQKWARKERQSMGNAFVIMWVLAGSSVHKTWPYLDQIIARLMVTYPDVKVVLTGDTLCQMLETGWENESRVIRRSGVWDIRQSLTFAKEQADLVIGPETGVLNAVGMEPVPKVIFLSHSSEENLTKYWKNTTVLTGDVPCYPCHRMHYGYEYCNVDEELHIARCQMMISPDTVFASIRNLMEKAA